MGKFCQILTELSAHHTSIFLFLDLVSVFIVFKGCFSLQSIYFSYVYSAGSTYIKTSVLKDDHTFTVHVVDPKESSLEDSDNETDDGKDGAEKSEFEKPEKENKDSKCCFGGKSLIHVYHLNV